MPGEFTVSCIQFTAVDGEKQATIEKALRLVRQAGERGSQLVVLPEVWTGLGYSDKTIYREIAETIPGPTTDLLAREAQRYGMHIAGSIYEDAGNGVYHNTCPLIGPDGAIIGLYRKTHLFDAPNRHDIQGGIRESDKVRAGDALPVFQTSLGPIGLSVCSDLRFPEVYREMTLRGARLLVCASAFLSPRFDHWEFFLRARAAENQVWVVASGQYGTEPKSGIGFVGRSMVVDPWGTITATASDAETCLSAVIDPSFVDEVRQRYPLLEQRRPELYPSIGAAARAACGGGVADGRTNRPHLRLAICEGRGATGSRRSAVCRTRRPPIGERRFAAAAAGARLERAARCDATWADRAATAVASERGDGRLRASAGRGLPDADHLHAGAGRARRGRCWSGCMAAPGSPGAGSLDWYDGANLAREGDVVFVGVNYRLGALGWLHRPGMVDADCGLSDMIAALAWVRDHIAAFGGDPSCVTVMGQSAGATSIGRLLMLPEARSLFHRAIMQSGGFGRGAYTSVMATERADQFLRLLDIDPQAADALARLRAVEVPRLLEAQVELAQRNARFA